jgi:calcium-dependent protein kinase
LYFLITHTHAFDFESESRGVQIRAIKTGKFNPLPDTVSDKIKDLIKHMLVVNPKKRYTLDQVLAHPWLHQNDDKVHEIDPTVINRLLKFRKGSKLRICLMNIVAKKVSYDQHSDLDEQFKLLDKSGNGNLTREELVTAINNCHLEVD